MTKVRIQNLTKSFGTAVAVNNISLDIEKGEFVSLLGPSGCGKTTTLRMMAGFMAPTSGTISVDDTVYSSERNCLPPEKRDMSMIFQSYAIWPNMTVAQNVAFGLKLRKLSGAEIKKRTQEVLDVVQLSHLADRYPNELSGGQQQRVALARAVVIRPQVLLLDEPLSNLDANLREEMRSEIRRLHDQFKITSIYVTHDQVEAMSTSDKIVVMNKGRIEQVGTPFDIYHRPKTRFVAGFIGKVSILSVTREGRGAMIGGQPYRSFGSLGATTESVAIRPESIDFLDAGNEEFSGLVLPAKVTSVTYLGDKWEYEVRIPSGETVLVTTHPRNRCELGDTLTLGIAETDIAEIGPDESTS